MTKHKMTAVLFAATLLLYGMAHAIETEPNDTMQTANTIGIGLTNAIVDASLSSEDDFDYYKFTTEANRTYVVETYGILANTSNNATGLYLYDSTGNELTEDDYGRYGTNDADARITYTFAKSGTYYILVRDYSNYSKWTGFYSLRILPSHGEPGANWDIGNDNEPNDALILANGVSVGYENAQTHQLVPNTGFVSNNTDHDWYHFNAEAGNTYVIETFGILANSSKHATAIWLYDATGTELANDDYGRYGTNDADARIRYTFSKSGTYYILVRDYSDYSDWTGQYSLRILPKYNESGASWDPENDYEPNDALVLANKINVGANNFQTRQLTSNSKYVSHYSDHDYYYFDATAGSEYVIETFNVQTDENGNGTGLYLYDENGTELKNDDYGRQGTNNVDARIEYTFTTPGSYFILVLKYSAYSDWTGTYSLRVLGEATQPAQESDCAGVEGGTAYTDSCGTCVGGTTGQSPCALDCAGVDGGTAYIDRCGTCVGGTTGQSPCALDCAGVDGGSAYKDGCNICVGGTTGKSPCVQDCNGDWGGTAHTDNCGDCVGGNTGQSPCSNETPANDDGDSGGGGCFINACFTGQP